MELKAERDPLLDALQTAARALSTRTTLPSLGGIMLVAAGGKAIARATDGELAVSVELEAEVDGDGEILLPGRLLADVSRALPQGTVTLAERKDKGDVELTAGTANFHLRLLDPEDFPRLPELEGDVLKMPRRRARRDRRPGRARRLPRRGPPDPHRHPRQRRGVDPDDGRDRLLPAQRQADRARGRRPEPVRGERAGPCDARARPGRRPARGRGGARSRCRATRSSSAPGA